MATHSSSVITCSMAALPSEETWDSSRLTPYTALTFCFLLAPTSSSISGTRSLACHSLAASDCFYIQSCYSCLILSPTCSLAYAVCRQISCLSLILPMPKNKNRSIYMNISVFDFSEKLWLPEIWAPGNQRVFRGGSEGGNRYLKTLCLMLFSDQSRNSEKQRRERIKLELKCLDWKKHLKSRPEPPGLWADLAKIKLSLLTGSLMIWKVLSTHLKPDTVMPWCEAER